MRRHALLIEVLIGFALTTTLLGGLTGLMLRISSMGKFASRELDRVIEECLTRKRLTHVLSELVLQEKEGVFALNSSGLVFTYNRGVQREPLFSADVLGRLYLENKQLILATWPNPKRFPGDHPPCKTEVLAEGIERLAINCYNPRPMENADAFPAIPYGWQGEWQAEWKALPRMIRLKLNDETITVSVRSMDKLLAFPKKT